ncbi:hypothetical protein KDE12_00725, partial [Campylobacter sp. faydin G-105]|uniref:hypothetical protein n=1 Tax=Campylobacter anatolicus TaxID=2829105 RepID=UPI001B8FC0A7
YTAMVGDKIVISYTDADGKSKTTEVTIDDNVKTNGTEIEIPVKDGATSTVTATVVDMAGNESESATGSIEVEAVIPEIESMSFIDDDKAQIDSMISYFENKGLCHDFDSSRYVGDITKDETDTSSTIKNLTNDASQEASVKLSSALPSGYDLVVYGSDGKVVASTQDGTLTSTDGVTYNFTNNISADGSYTYTAKIENNGVSVSNEKSVSMTLDSHMDIVVDSTSYKHSTITLKGEEGAKVFLTYKNDRGETLRVDASEANGTYTLNLNEKGSWHPSFYGNAQIFMVDAAGNVSQSGIAMLERVYSDGGHMNSGFDKDRTITYDTYHDGSNIQMTTSADEGYLTSDANDMIVTNTYVSGTKPSIINTYGGDDTVFIGTNLSNGKVDLGEGNNKLVVGASDEKPANGYITAGAEVKAGSGDDILSVRTNIDGSRIDLGDGDNTISVGNNTTEVGGYIVNSTITTGSGDDVLNVKENFRGGANADLGDGNNTINIDGAVQANASITTHSGDDTINIKYQVVDSTIDTGAGNDTLIIGGSVNLGNKIYMGDGDDALSIRGGIGVASTKIDLGAGDDTVTVYNSKDTIANIDGGDGYDTLVLHEAKSSVDFTNISNRVNNIEEISLAADGKANTIKISAQDVLDITDDNNILKISTSEDGIVGDSVKLETGRGSSTWTKGESSDGYTSYTAMSGGKTVVIQIDDDIRVDL